MAKPTHDEIIRDLDRQVAVLESRVERTDWEVRELLHLKPTVAVLISEMAQVKKDQDEASRRRWSLVPVLVGALLGGFFVILAQFLAAALRK